MAKKVKAGKKKFVLIAFPALWAWQAYLGTGVKKRRKKSPQ